MQSTTLRSRALVSVLLAATMGMIPFMLSACGRGNMVFSRDDFFARALQRNEKLWNDLTEGDLPSNRGVRWIYNYALLLAESGRSEMLPRIARLVELGGSMQDKNPASPTFGNFRWYWRNEKVTDLNAVEFVSHHMIPLWVDHRDRLDAQTRSTLRETLRRSADACLRHKVHPGYTNIAISNAVNLILLGEQFARTDALNEGLKRLDAICLTSWRYGICEYDSPTYYGVDLDELVLLDKYARNPRARQAGRAMLELFWTDIAANWYSPGGHLGGTHSRSYNYPCGASDFLDRHLAHAGWARQVYSDWTARRFLDSPESRFLDGAAWLDAIPGPWKPSVKLHETAHKQYPRDVRQRFGSRPACWRRHMIYRDITLGCSGKAYGVTDLPLTISLPGDRSASRCYFIADGREDPYGKRKFSVGSAGHTKALHLAPLWAAASGGDQAMAIAFYSDQVVNRPTVTNLQSHFVFRRPDAMYVDSKLCSAPTTVPRGAILTLRYGTAAAAVCVPWATRTDQSPAPIRIIDDKNPHDVLRLTVEHFAGKKPGRPEGPLPGAAIWVRIGSGLTDEQFDKWRRELTPPKFNVSSKSLQFSSGGGREIVSLTVDHPWDNKRKVSVKPTPPGGILSVNGKELGRRILESLEPIRRFRTSGQDR
ncbi:MAG: hypothetical protein QGH60_07225 [Phycisphaerae bacterium]|nr:hypothetical protein [Phycisphaerae bacterium]